MVVDACNLRVCLGSGGQQKLARLDACAKTLLCASRHAARAHFGPGYEIWRSWRSDAGFEGFQNVDENAEKVELGRQPSFLDARVITSCLARIDAALRHPNPGCASFDLLQDLGSAPNGVM